MLQSRKKVYMKKIRQILLVVTALVVVGAFAACGQANPTPTTSGGEGESQAAAETTAGGSTSTNSENSNSVVVGMSQELDSLDPHSAEGAGTREVLFNLFEGLIKPTASGELEPAVASDYEVAEDAASITFTLRDGITFSDGTPVTVEDVKYSLDRYADVQGSGSAFSDYKETVLVDDKTVQVNLTQPNSEFIFGLTCAIIPESNDANVATAPIGTGPFKFVSCEPGEALVVEKNENYWKEGLPYLDEVTFKLVDDADMAVSQLTAGTIDIYQHLTADQASTVGDGFDILEGSEKMVQALFLNNAQAPFDDVRVRQAICYAIDRDMVNDMVFEGRSHLLGTNMIPSYEKYYNADTENVYARDIEKAKALLEEAGQTGLTFTIKVPNNYQPHIDTAQVLVENLKEAGINAEIDLIDWTSWLSDVYTDRNYQSTVIAVDNRFLAPSTWFNKNISTGDNNFTNYSNPEFDAEYEAALAEIDTDKKVEHYFKLQEILTADAASAYIEDPAVLVAVNSKLEGYEFYPISAQDMSLVKYK